MALASAWRGLSFSLEATQLQPLGPKGPPKSGYTVIPPSGGEMEIVKVAWRAKINKPRRTTASRVLGASSALLGLELPVLVA